MTDFRSRRDGSHYPISGGRPSYPASYWKENIEQFIKQYKLRGEEARIARLFAGRANSKDKQQFFWTTEWKYNKDMGREKCRLIGVYPDGKTYAPMVSLTQYGNEVELYIPDNIKEINGVSRKQFLEKLSIYNDYEEIWEARFFHGDGKDNQRAHKHYKEMKFMVMNTFNST